MHTSDPRPTTADARLTLWLCFATAILEGYDLQVVSVAGPLLREAMQLNPRQLGYAFSASLMGLALGAAYGGTLADRIGRKKVLVASIIGLGVLTLLTALASDFRELVTLRVLSGVAMGGAMPNLIALSAAAAAAAGGRTTSKVTAMVCGMPAGGILAALGAHALGARYGWQALFLLGGALTLLIVPLLIWRLKETAPVADRGAAPLAWPRALFGEGRAKITLLLWLLFILTLAMLSLISGWAPTLVVDKGLPVSAGFSALMTINIGGICGALIIATLCDRWSVRYTMLGIYAGMALSLWLFSSSSSAASVIPLAGAVGFCVLGAQFALYGLSPQLYPPACHGTGVGAAVAAGRIGSIVGPIVAGYMISRGASADSVIVSLVPVALAAGLVLLALLAASRQVFDRRA